MKFDRTTIGDVVAQVWCALAFLTSGWNALPAAFFFLVNPTPWNFPGDPPLFDLLLLLAPQNLAVIVPLYLWWRWRGRRPALHVVGMLGMFWAAVTVVSLLGVVERHSPRWSGVRAAIRGHADAIAADAGGPRLLNDQEFESLRQRHLPQPVPVQLTGFGTVHLRMTGSAYPYVGVDFGEGRNAFFDLKTMYCLYSD
jgi:hypothetical protein